MWVPGVGSRWQHVMDEWTDGHSEEGEVSFLPRPGAPCLLSEGFQRKSFSEDSSLTSGSALGFLLRNEKWGFNPAPLPGHRGPHRGD